MPNRWRVRLPFGRSLTAALENMNRCKMARTGWWLAGLSLILAAAARAEFKTGAAMRVITPNPLLPVSGGLGPTVAVREKRGELTARAVVFQRDQLAVAVVGLDLLGFPSVLGDRVRARVPRIPGRNILIGATHTHSAPDCYAFPDGRGGHTGDLAYMELVCQKTAEAINEAIDRLEPAWIKVATGEAQGKIAYNYYAPDLYDRRISVVQAVRPAGTTIATLVNYAIHPEVLGPRAGVLSPDLVGPLCERLEAKVGGMAVFINGAQGGMITADNRDLSRARDPLRGYWNDLQTWDECLRIGHLMADEALRLVCGAPVQQEPALHCADLDVRFPVHSDAIWNVVLHSPLRYPRNADRSITSRLNLVNLGNAQILTIPGEALPNIGFYLKRKMRGEHNLLFGLTNDAFGYILTKVDFGSFPRYEYVSRVSLGEMTGEILIEKSLELIAKNPAPDRLSAAKVKAAEAKDGVNAPTIDQIRSAVSKALPLLERGARGSMEERPQCFTCHNQGLPILALTTARSRGFTIDEENLREQVQFTARFLERNRENYLRGQGQGGQAATAGYALWALEAGGWQADETTAAVAEYLLLFDRSLDRWRIAAYRPPSEYSDFTSTYLALRALRHFGTTEQKDRIDRRLAAVRQWLVKTPARETEDRVFRLWGLKAAGAAAAEVQAAAADLLRTQRPDGGWAQSDDMASDAYAAGSALAALNLVGELTTTDPQYRRGLAFLVEQQLPDGSWHVRSRSKPFQTYFESGYPHGADQFISISASGWATIALTLAFERPAGRRSAP
jgi:hypothetical protein